MILYMVLIINIIFQGVLFAQEYSGYSDYRLVFDPVVDDEFEINQDVLIPTKKQIEREKVINAVMSSSMGALIPLSSLLSGNLTGSEPSLYDLVSKSVNTMSRSLRKEIASISVECRDVYPVEQHVYLIPWLEREEDLFYSVEKLSVSSAMINILKSAKRAVEFDTFVTKNIEKFQKKLYEESDDPVFLLGFRAAFKIDPDNKSSLTVSALLGIKPTPVGGIPFEKPSPKVNLKKIEIPDIPGKGIVGIFTFTLDLSKNPKAPTLDLSFGDFEKFERGGFKLLDEGSKLKTPKAPRMVGNVSKRGLGFIGIKFNFMKLVFTLEPDIPIKMMSDDTEDITLLTELDILISPGLSIGNSYFVLGGIHAESVDEEFGKEINTTLNTEIKKAGDKINDLAESKTGLTTAMLKEAFGKIFGERGE